MGYKVEVEVSDTQLQDIIDVLNEYELDEEGDTPLTLEEVKSKPLLIHYLCYEAVTNDCGLYDPRESWNNDVWCDFAEFR